VALKANGISLLRILRPTFVFMGLLMVMNFLFLNYVTINNVVRSCKNYFW
jgi:lipopolysaccharide export LptBFGC system permease protein LptF